MEDYLETILRLNIEKNYINISAIVRNNDKINLIRLVILTIRNSVNEYWEQQEIANQRISVLI